MFGAKHMLLIDVCVEILASTLKMQRFFEKGVLKEMYKSANFYLCLFETYSWIFGA